MNQYAESWHVRIAKMDNKTPIDITAVSATGLTWLGMLPEVAAFIASLLTIVWFAIRIFETKTVRRLLR